MMYYALDAEPHRVGFWYVIWIRF